MSVTTPAIQGDTTDVVKATPEELKAARERWGLDAAPTAASREMQEAKAIAEAATAVRHQKRAEKVKLYGTPLDYARSLINRPMPKEWKEGIRRYSPKTDQTAYLDIFWKQPPGEPDKLRAVIYEMVPAKDIPTGMRLLLEDTPWWELPQDQRAGREKMVSPFQWEIYRTRREWARPLWCIQGDNGGTPIAYTELEQDLLRIKGQPTTPPHLGALSFAPWDARVEKALAARDRLWKFQGDIERMRKSNASPAEIEAEYEAQKKEFRKRFFAWWGEQLEEATEFLSWYETKCEADHTLRRATRAEMLAAARLEEEFIEHGRMPVVKPWEND